MLFASGRVEPSTLLRDETGKVRTALEWARECRAYFFRTEGVLIGDNECLSAVRSRLEEHDFMVVPREDPDFERLTALAARRERSLDRRLTSVSQRMLAAAGG